MLCGGLQYGNNYWSSKNAADAQQKAQVEYSHPTPKVLTRNIPPPQSNTEPDWNESENIGQQPGKPNWVDKSDLAAQWVMALSTIGILIFTGVGLSILRKTLNETEAAAEHTEQTLGEARKTTRAAFESNDIALGIAKTQFGGVLVARKARVRIDKKRRGIHFQVKIANVSDTPVYNVRYGANCSIENSTKALVGKNDKVNPGFGLRALAPGDSKWAKIVFQNKKQMLQAVRLGSSEFIKIWGVVSWTGISREKNAYLFSFYTRASITEKPFKKLHMAPWGNTLVPEEDRYQY